MTDLSPVQQGGFSPPNPNQPPFEPQNDAGRRRSTEETAQSTLRLIPALTSFDLLEGEFKKSRTGRLVVLGAFAVTALAVMLLLAQGISNTISTNNVRNSVGFQEAQAAVLQQEINARAPIAGLTPQDAASYIQTRADSAAKLTSAEMEYAALTKQIMSTAPDGLFVSRVEFLTEPGTPAPGPATVVCPDGRVVPGVAAVPAAASTVPGKTAAPVLVDKTSLSIAAHSDGSVDYEDWVISLRKIPSLKAVETTEKGSAPDFAVLIKATLRPYVFSARTIAFQSDTAAPVALNPCYQKEDATSVPSDQSSSSVPTQETGVDTSIPTSDSTPTTGGA